MADMTLTGNLLHQKPLPKKWNTERLAIIGAFSGLIAGSAHELAEVFFHDTSEIEPFLQVTVEIGASSLVGYCMFAVSSMIRNHLKWDLG